MSVTLFEFSYAVLWILVILLCGAVLVLYRYHGVMLLNNREGLAGQGPEIDKSIRSIELRDVTGRAILLGAPSKRPVFVFLGSPTCQPCKDAKPALVSFAKKYSTVVDILLISSGTQAGFSDYTAEMPNAIQVIYDPRNDVSSRLRVSYTPFAFIIDENGIVQGKGAPTTTDSLEWFIEQIYERSNRSQSKPHVVPVNLLK